jgi:protein-glutamine gamma-glutamyltransferase
VAQAKSTNGFLGPTTYSLIWEQSHAQFESKKNPINLYYFYFAICLLSASTANTGGFTFYVIAEILVVILLWQIRPQRSAPVIWAGLILLVSSMGFLGHLQLHQLQAKLEQQTAPWLSGLSGDSVDPYQNNPRMGGIGELKQSNAIVFRVAGDRSSFPLLLREATYNKYGSASWIATQSKFKPVQPSADGKTWNLNAIAAKASSINVSGSLNDGKGILRLPNGTSEIGQLTVESKTSATHPSDRTQTSLQPSLPFF